MSIQSGTSPGAIISAGSTPAPGGVTSVFGRSGAVVAVAGDYTSSQITNASGVVGATVTAALNTLLADAVHLSVTAPADVTKSAALVGVGTTAARSDHKHDITTAAAVSISTANTEGVATTLARSDHTHLGVVSIFGRSGAVVAVSGDYTSTLVTNSSSVPGATVTAALDAAGTYYWYWADAVARQAQAVTAPQVGGVGYQIDMALEYKLVSVSPSRWGRLPWVDVGALHQTSGRPGDALIDNFGIGATVVVGTAGSAIPSGTTRSLELFRSKAISAGAANSVILIRSSNAALIASITGYRSRRRIVTELPRSDWRWFSGTSGLPAPTTNIDPATLLNCLGIGRSGTEANVQLYHNDGAGTATKIDLGAAFPAATAGIGFSLEVYSLNGSSYSYQVSNIDTNAEVSGVLTTNIPVTTPSMISYDYATNNLTVAAVEFSHADWQIGQINI